MAPFQITARVQQGTFRDNSSHISSNAKTQLDSQAIKNTHLLKQGYELENLFPHLRQNDFALKFFKERRIKWWNSSRSGDTKKDKGEGIPTRNMASSQILCVNFLMPFWNRPDVLLEMMRVIDPDIRELIPITYPDIPLKVVSYVDFEWVGLKGSLETGSYNRGQNNTSIDAVIFGITKDNLRRAYLMEWKYVEEYSKVEWLGEGESGATRRNRYLHLYKDASSPFNGILNFDDLLYEPFYQIMRMFLLSEKMKNKPSDLEIDDAKIIVICPEENFAYRNTITSPGFKGQFPLEESVLGMMQKGIKDPAHFIMSSPKELYAVVANNPAIAGTISAWVSYQNERYKW